MGRRVDGLESSVVPITSTIEWNEATERKGENDPQRMVAWSMHQSTLSLLPLATAFTMCARISHLYALALL